MSSLPAFAGLEEFVEYAHGAGWSDGLPVLPPTHEAVAQMLATVDTDADAALWQRDESHVSVGDVAVAAVLAGCEAPYFPVVLTAVGAYFDMVAGDGLHVPTLVDASPCVIVNGPIRNQIGVNCGIGLYGPGWRANATIGRAVAFVVRASLQGAGGAFGDPGQYTLCFGEDEDSVAWTPLHAMRGFDAGTSAVTVHLPLVRSLSYDRVSRSPDDLLDGLVRYARGRVSGAGWFGDDACALLLVVSPETRVLLGDWSKEAVHQRLYERLVADDGSPIQPVRLSSPDDLIVVAAGGPAFSAVQLMLAHRFSPVTRAILEQ
jgi:hypothetical protein